MWEEQYQTLTGRKLSLDTSNSFFFSYISLLLAFSSIVVADLGFCMYVWLEVSIVISLDTETLSLNVAEEV